MRRRVHRKTNWDSIESLEGRQLLTQAIGRPTITVAEVQHSPVPTSLGRQAIHETLSEGRGHVSSAKSANPGYHPSHPATRPRSHDHPAVSSAKATPSSHPVAGSTESPRASSLATPAGPAVRQGTIFSNYDASTLGYALTAGGVPINDPTGPVTYTISTGQFDVETPTSDGFTASLTSSVTLSGDPNDVNTGDVYVIVPPSYQGTIQITEQFSDGTPTATVNVPVVQHDDGSYEAATQDLGSLGSGPAAVPNVPPSTTPVAVPAAAPTGVVQGIDWSTLVMVRRDVLTDTDPGTGVQVVETGTVWQVKTVKGSTITLFEDDPLAQQPAATRANPNFVDPSYNCHGYTFGATGIVDKNGVTHSFKIPLSADVSTILADAYTKVNVDQAFAAASAGKSVYFIFSNAGGNQHSAVKTPSQSMTRRYFFNYTWLGDSTQVSSKNGDQAFSANTTIGALKSVYPDMTITMYILNTP